LKARKGSHAKLSDGDARCLFFQTAKKARMKSFEQPFEFLPVFFRKDGLVRNFLQELLLFHIEFPLLQLMVQLFNKRCLFNNVLSKQCQLLFGRCCVRFGGGFLL